MPNHVTNRLTVKGPKKVLDLLWEAWDYSCLEEGPVQPVRWMLRCEGCGTGEVAVEPIPLSCPACGQPRSVEMVMKKKQVTSHFDFRAIIPQPKVVELCSGGAGLSLATQRDNPNRNWYEWQRHHWGTKWNSYNATRERMGDEEIVYQFDTAWAGPLPVIRQLARLFPETSLRLVSLDEGWNFCTMSEFTRGVHAMEREIECSKTNEEFVQLCKELKGYDPNVEEPE